jgi:hypothetical protein
LSLYFNGVLLSEASAPAGYVDDVIDWSTVNNIYANRFHTYSPSAPTHYHKISAYDKILTQYEISTLYYETQSSIVKDLPVLYWNYNNQLVDSVNSVVFQNDFGIDISNNYIDLNQSGEITIWKPMFP